MQAPHQDIYHKDEPPALARKRRRWLSLKQNPGDKPSPASAVGSGSAHRGEEVARLEQRRRRRRREHSTEDTLLNRLTWLTVVLVAAAYWAMLIGVEFWMRKHPRIAPKPAAPAAVVPSVTSTNKPLPAGASQPIEERILHWRLGLRVLAEVSGKLEKGALSDSRAILEKALTEVPDMTWARLELALILERQKNYEEAKTLLLEVLDNDPSLLPARAALGRIYLSLGDPTSALSMARWIIEADTYSMAAHELAATALLNLDQAAEAIQHLRRLVALNRDNLTAHNNLGSVYLKLGDFRSALQTFREVLRLDEGNTVAQYNLAAIYARQGLVAEVVDTLGKAAQQFGTGFVATWTQSSDFDPVRQDPAFQRFLAEGPAPTTPSSASGDSTPPATNAVSK